MNLRDAWSEFVAMQSAYRKYGIRCLADNGVSRPRQVFETFALRLASGKLTAEDYYRTRVYRRDLSFAQKRQFISQGALHILGRSGWMMIAHDKLVAQALLEKEGVRTARILAVCHPLRSYGQARALRTVDDVRKYLESEATYPFAAKPTTGMFSYEFALVEGFETTTGMLRINGQAPIAARSFAEQCMAHSNGTLFQERLLPHPDIVQHVSPQICTLRLIVQLEHDHLRLYAAIWKIAANGNVADNYWRPGNLMARLDPDSGKIMECMSGLGPDFRLIEDSPVTGKPLRGFAVPFYREARELSFRIAPAFVGLKIQAWDIAITPDGPVALEVNGVGSVFLPQLATGRGMSDEAFQSYLARASDGFSPWSRT
jgi:hypothetical protein